MPPSVKTMMPTTIEPSAPAAAAGPSNINLREFVADDDAANFGSALWKTIDQSAFVLAQREALEAFNFAKALRLSEETAAEEAQKRQHSEASGVVSASVAAAANPDAPTATPTEHQHSSASAAQSQPIAIRQYSRRPSYSQDGAPASSIPRSLAADGVQPVLLENKPSTSPPSSSSFSPAIPIPPIKSSASSSPPYSYSYSHSKALSASSSGLSSASSSSRITKQPSQNLSLSTFSSTSSSAASSSSSSYVLPAIQVQVVDSHHRIASSSSSSHSQISSQSHLHSQSQSRASSHSNAIPASSSSHPHNRNDRIEQRSKREAEPSSSSSSSTLSTSQSQSHSAFSSSSASSSCAQSLSSSSSDMTTTNTSTKRRRAAERQPSPLYVSSSTTSSSPASRNSTYITNNATAAPLVAPPISEPKKSSASARDVLLGHIMNPVSASAAKEGNTSSSNATTRMTSATGNTNVNSVPTPLQEQAKHQSQSQSHSQPQSRLRRRSAHPTSERRDFLDLFTASRNCVRCGNLVVSPRSQPSYTHDPFSLPFSDLLHVTCSACGTNHCRGCFAVVRCPRHCTGGQSCAVRNNCCPDVRAIAIFEALSSFDCIYAAEAGFGSGSASGSGVAGKGKESHLKDTKEGAGSDRGDKELRQAYLKQLISNSKDKDKDKARSMRRFEDAFVRTLRILCSWLQPPSSLNSSSSSEDEKIDEKGVKHPSSSSSSHHSSSSSSSSTSTQPLHPTIAPLFAHSYLPEVMHLFLSTSSARDWVAHSETYHALLALLRHMFNHGAALAPVLLLPLARIEESCGLREIVWDGGVIEWEWGKYKDKDATSVDNAKAKGTSKDKDGDKDRGVREVRRWEALGEVVKGLEKNTRPGLRSLVGRLQFTGTVEKVESLCEGISYLLLQQVVGGV